MKRLPKPKTSRWRFRREAAVARVIAEGSVRTYDMSGRRGDTDSSGGEGGKDSTLDVAKAVADYAGS